MEFNTLHDVIDFALAEETAAEELYRETAATTDDLRSSELLLELAKEEETHRLVCRTLLEEEALQQISLPADRNLSRYLEEIPLRPKVSFAEVLVYAIKKEEQAEQLYRSLADSWSDPGIRGLFLALAEMERSHRVKLEEYFLQNVIREI